MGRGVVGRTYILKAHTQGMRLKILNGILPLPTPAL